MTSAAWSFAAAALAFTAWRQPIHGPSTLRQSLSTRGAAAPRLCVPQEPTVPAADATAAASSAATASKPVDDWIARVVTSLESRTFVKLTLSGNAAKQPDADAHLRQLRRVQARFIQLKRGPRLQLTLKYEHRDEVRNIELDAVGSALADYVGPRALRNARLFTSEADIELAINKRGAARLVELAPALEARSGSAESHDRRKGSGGAAAVESAEPFLVALGVTTAAGKPRPGQAAKLRQIRKFVETLNTLVGPPPAAGTPLRVCDVGCGRGYLTFAAHAALHGAGWSVQTRGVELRPAIVHEVDGIARRLGAPFEDLRFEEGAIESMLPPMRAAAASEEHRHGDTEAAGAGGEGLDVLVALHACDTATDDALWCGVLRGARTIVTAPCCHKEVRRQLDPHMASHSRRQAARAEGGSGGGHGGEGGGGHPLSALLRHGIFRERTAEMATDTARALLLELAGYDVKVFEFVGGEHTAKNVIIAASLRAVPPSEAEKAQTRRQLHQQLELFGVRTQRLARWMGELPWQPGGPGDPGGPARELELQAELLGASVSAATHAAAPAAPASPPPTEWRGRRPAPRLDS